MENNTFRKHLLFIILSFLLFSCDTKNGNKTGTVMNFVSKFRKADYSKIYNYNVQLSRLIDSLKIGLASINIEIDKSDYILSVYSDTVLLKQYPVVLGKNPKDDKLVQGDFCTPEGNYRIKDKYEHKKWSKFIWLDYPNAESLLKIDEAKRAGLIPAGSSPGGDVGIHGVEQGFDYAIDYGINWTAGCIALKNKDVNEIYNVVGKETRILIHK